jgi:chemotaxis protein histidine kinase CheA
MAPVCVRHRLSLVAGLRALWSEIAAREDTALATVAACGDLAAPLADLARAAGYPMLAGMLGALADGWAAAPVDARLGVDASIDLAAWCDTLVIGLEEGLDADAVELLLTLNDPGVANLAAFAVVLAAELDPARPEQVDPPQAASAVAVTVDEAVEAATIDDSEPTVGPAAASGPGPVDAARHTLSAQGIDIAELSEQELLDLAQMLGAGDADLPVMEMLPAAIDLPVAEESRAALDLPVSRESPTPEPDPVHAARMTLSAQGIDTAELSEQELLDLARMLGAGDADLPIESELPADADLPVESELPVSHPDPVDAARQTLAAQGIDTTELSEQELLDLARMLGAGDADLPVESGLPVSEPDPIDAARLMLSAQGIDIAELSEQELLDIAQMLGTGDADAAPPVDTESDTEWLGGATLGDIESGDDSVEAGTWAPSVATDADGTLWIAEEELALTRAAITEQVLPHVVQLVEAADADAEHRVRQELGYQLGLIGNALQMFGIETLDSLLQAMAEGCLDRRLDGEALIRISAALLGFLDRAEVEAASFLAGEARDFGLVDADHVSRFEAEAARIRIGLDPALIAARKRHVEAGDLDLRPAADVLPDVLNSMLRELPGNAARLGQALRALVDRGDTAPMDEARRIAHTLKGDANTVGVRGLANLTHSLEDSLIELLKAPERLSPALGSFLLEAADLVEECADHLLGRGPAPAALGPLFQQALDWSNRLFEGIDGEAAGSEPPTDAAPIRSADPPAAPTAADAAPEAAQTLAVDTRLLDELQRLAGELTILSRQVDQRLTGLLALERELRTELAAERNLTAQLDDLVALRGAALQSTALTSNPEVDALELDEYNELHTVSRRLSETHGDNEELVRRYGRLLRDLEPLRAEQQRLNEDLQRTVARTRTLPFGDICARLQRVVRQTARQVGKVIDLQLEGEPTPIDAELLERLVEPLSHLLRNAIDHGIEIPELRRAAGKPERGTLKVDARIEADRACITIGDDGRGLDLRAIRAKAIQLGMIDSDIDLGPDALAQLILAPGFSTRDAVSQISGRGVGMDVVNQRIQELRGSLSIHSEAGRGTRFALRLPLSRSQANVVVAEGHGVSLAVVASAIQRIVLLRAEDIRVDEGQALQMEVDGQCYPAQPIEALFDRHAQISLPGERPTLGLLISLPGGMSQVLCCQSVGEITRAVVKPTSPWLPPIPAVRGITQLGDGRLAPVVDIDVLLDRRRQAPMWQVPAGGTLAVLPRIVVADDSLSVRRALEQLMQDAGYEVVAARDGLEALQLIQQRPPVAVLLDLEMPRMNGLEVCRYLRNDNSTRHTPVVMITSRASDRYRLMAEEAGVTRLLGKPFSEDELVTLVRDLVSASAERGDALFA